MTTHMLTEIREIPAAIERLLDQSDNAIRIAAAELRQTDPAVIVTVARGSSDHAATFFKYATELLVGTPVASVGPSIASIYDAPLRLSRTACVAISQSGKSPDILEMAKSAAGQGAQSIAITNDPDAPLGAAATHTIPLQAGVEHSVAATKTFVSSAVASLALLAHWQNDTALMEAIAALPGQCEAAAAADWSPLADALVDQDSLFVLGRGLSFAMALEAALKFKETCRIQGEAYSSAEILHGPVSMVEPGFPVLVLAARDASEPSITGVARAMADKGANVFATSSSVEPPHRLPFVATGHPFTDPLVLIVSFYACVEALARARGIDPDTPRNLRKVTKTL